MHNFVSGTAMGIKHLFEGKHLFFLGIKGTGMASLAVLALRMGAIVSGVDSREQFITDLQLSLAGIPWIPFDACPAIPADTDVVVASAAYTHPEHPLLADCKNRKIDVREYPDMLALLSRSSTCHGIAGTHGKTTTSACVSHMLAHSGLGTYGIYGGLASPSQVPAYKKLQSPGSVGHVQGRAAATLPRMPNEPDMPKIPGVPNVPSSGSPDPFAGISGDRIGILEACEYRSHLLRYSLASLLITSIEQDHPDWFASESEVQDTFHAAVMALAPDAVLVCCTDDPGAAHLARQVALERPDLQVITYGTNAQAQFRLKEVQSDIHETAFQVGSLSETFHTSLPGVDFCLDVLGAALLAASIVLSDAGLRPAKLLASDPALPALLQEGRSFAGVMGRMERRGHVGDVQFVDDYAHHPTQIAGAIAAVRQWYPERHLVVVFMPHTRSRTQALFDAFAEALSLADLVIIQHTYAARGDGDAHHAPEAAHLAEVIGAYFAANDSQALAMMLDLLQDGDVCITMGAGNNRNLFEQYASAKAVRQSP